MHYIVAAQTSYFDSRRFCISRIRYDKNEKIDHLEFNIATFHLPVSCRITQRRIMKSSAALIGAIATGILVVGSALPAAAATGGAGPLVASNFDSSAVVVRSDSPEAEVRVQDAGQGTRGTCATRFAATGPIGGGWSGEYKWIGCSYIGASAGAKKTYSFSAVPGQLAPGCGQGFGYKGGKTPYWASVGCYESAGTKLDWGNVAGTPKFKVKTMVAVIASSNYWL